MKKGNFRTNRIYPKKGEIKYVIEAKANNIWKPLGSGENHLIFDNEEDARNSLISIFQYVKYFSVPTNKHGIDAEYLTTGVKKIGKGVIRCNV